MAINIRFKAIVDTLANIATDKFQGRLAWATNIARMIWYYDANNYGEMARRDVLETFSNGIQDSTLTSGQALVAGSSGRIQSQDAETFRGTVSAAADGLNAYGGVGDDSTVNDIPFTAAVADGFVGVPAGAYRLSEEIPPNAPGAEMVGPGNIMVPVDEADVSRGYHRYPFVEDAGRITFGEEYLQALHKKFRDAQGGPRPYIYLDGDSTIEGYAALYGTPGDNALDDDHKPHNIIAKALRRRGHYVGVVNRAVSGSGIAAFHLSNADIDDADGIVISFGINDTIGAGGTYATVEDWIAVYRSKLAAIRARRNVHQCSIIIKTSSHVSVTLEGRDETQAWMQRKALRQAARDYQCAFFDTPAYWSDVRSNSNTGVGITGVWNDATPFPTLLQDGLMDDPYRTVPALLDADKYGSAIHPLALMNVWIWERIADFLAPPGMRRYATNSVFADGSSKSVSASDRPWAYDLGITYSRAPSSVGFPIDGAVTTLRTPDKVTHQTLMAYKHSTVGGVTEQDGLTATRHGVAEVTCVVTFPSPLVAGNIPGIFVSTVEDGTIADVFVPFNTSSTQTLTDLVAALTGASYKIRSAQVVNATTVSFVLHTPEIPTVSANLSASVSFSYSEAWSAWYLPYNRITRLQHGGPDSWFVPHNGEFDHYAPSPGVGGAPAAGWYHYRHWCYSGNADYARQEAVGFAGGVGSWYRDRVAGVWGAWSQRFDVVTREMVIQPLPITNAAPGVVTVGPSGSMRSFGFDGNTQVEELFYHIDLQHDYIAGTSLIPHVHWLPSTNATGNVVWKWDYQWVESGGTFGAPTTASCPAVAAGGTAWVDKRSEVTISGAGHTYNSRLLLRLYRDPNDSGDTYGADAVLSSIGVHYSANPLQAG